MMGFWAQFRSFSRPKPRTHDQPIRIQHRLLHADALLVQLSGRDPWPGSVGSRPGAGCAQLQPQGLLFVGGTLADRLGYKQLIVAGCLLRIGAFGLLAIAQSLSTLLIAAAATAFAGALVQPGAAGLSCHRSRRPPNRSIRHLEHVQPSGKLPRPTNRTGFCNIELPDERPGGYGDLRRPCPRTTPGVTGAPIRRSGSGRAGEDVHHLGLAGGRGQ